MKSICALLLAQLLAAAAAPLVESSLGRIPANTQWSSVSTNLQTVTPTLTTIPTETPASERIYSLAIGDPTPNHTQVSVRVLHAAPGVVDVDVNIGTQIVAAAIPFKNITAYTKVDKLNTTLEAYHTMANKTDVLVTSTFIPEASAATAYTLALVPLEQGKLGFLTYDDSAPQLNSDEAALRFIHLAFGTPPLEVRLGGAKANALADDAALIPNVTFAGVSPYVKVQPGALVLEVWNISTNTTLANSTMQFSVNVTAVGGAPYTLFVDGAKGQVGTLFAADAANSSPVDDEPSHWWVWLIVILGILLVLGLAFFAYRYKQRASYLDIDSAKV